MYTLTSSILELPGVGSATATRLRRLGINTISDLVFYYPTRWEDFSDIRPLAMAQPGEQVTVRGKLTMLANRRSAKRRMIVTEALVTDESGSIQVVWFNQPFLTKTLQVGDELFLSGKISSERYAVQLVSPLYEKASENPTHTARIVPVYSLTQGVTQKQIRSCIKIALASLQTIEDFLPATTVQDQKLLDLSTALQAIHFPTSHAQLEAALNRLKFDELLLFQLELGLIRNQFAAAPAPLITFQEQAVKDFIATLPYTLTDDQKKAAWQVISDMAAGKPMNRLIQGEVGSGKTVVAAIALLNAVVAGWQGVVMVPTEILAKQHYDHLYKILSAANIRVALLTRTYHELNGEDVSKAAIHKTMAVGDVDVVIGTHALLQDDVHFMRLGLTVIDEQHRFGVDQRKRVREQSGDRDLMPHLLSMTATPIPRTLALTFYGDLAISNIRQLPAGRKHIATSIVPPHKRSGLYGFIQQQIDQGRQGFVVCPLIDPSDTLGARSATQEFERLQGVFPRSRLGLLHGRLKQKEKEETMAAFVAGEIDVLICTSVIEVGVNIPNATVMVIEGAQRFGMSQLHQFRGRVGRSDHQSYCFLLTDMENPPQRLSAFVAAKDGFDIAQADLELRGPGQLQGYGQSGWLDFKLASLRDYELMKITRDVASEILHNDPDLSGHQILLQKVFTAPITTHRE